MPITSSAKKAARQNLRHRKRNLARQESYKTLVKETRKFITGKKIKEAQEKLAAVSRALDKAAKNNVIDKNKASRLKSRLAQAINKASKASS